MPRCFQVPFRVYWSECDPAGIMYFANYMRRFEQAEEDFFGTLGRGSRQQWLDSHSVWMPRVEVHCRFFRPARMEDELVIEMRVRDLRDKSVVLEFEVRNTATGDVHCSASYTLVCVDSGTFKARSIPGDIREPLAAWL